MGILLALSGHVATVSIQSFELISGFGIGNTATEYLEVYRVFSTIVGGTATAFGAWRGFQWTDISAEDRADLRAMEEMLLRAGKRSPRENIAVSSDDEFERHTERAVDEPTLFAPIKPGDATGQFLDRALHDAYHATRARQDVVLHYLWREITAVVRWWSPIHLRYTELTGMPTQTKSNLRESALRLAQAARQDDVEGMKFHAEAMREFTEDALHQRMLQLHQKQQEQADSTDA